MSEKRFKPWETAPFFELDGLPLVNQLKDNWRALREEYEAYVREPARDECPYPLQIYSGGWVVGTFRSNDVEYDYFPAPLQRKLVRDNLGEDADGMNDEEIHTALLRMCKEGMAHNRKLCPLLASIVEPLYPEHCVMYTYSTLKPGVRLHPHCGADAGNVRIHFCLKEAEGCRLHVLNQMRTWKNGEAWAFDDAFLHSAEHNGTSDRVIVMIDLKKDHVEAELRRLAAAAATV